MDKPDTSYLFFAEMDSQPEEESFALILKNKSASRCSVARVAGIMVVVVLISTAFIAGYLVRIAVTKSQKNGDFSPTTTPAPSQIRLQDLLAGMSAVNIERNLRFVY